VAEYPDPDHPVDPVLICETFIRGSNGLVQVHSTRTDMP
jgi:hypothetical protein